MGKAFLQGMLWFLCAKKLLAQFRRVRLCVLFGVFFPPCPHLAMPAACFSGHSSPVTTGAPGVPAPVQPLLPKHNAHTTAVLLAGPEKCPNFKGNLGFLIVLGFDLYFMLLTSRVSEGVPMGFSRMGAGTQFKLFFFPLWHTYLTTHATRQEVRSTTLLLPFYFVIGVGLAVPQVLPACICPPSCCLCLSGGWSFPSDLTANMMHLAVSVHRAAGTDGVTFLLLAELG